MFNVIQFNLLSGLDTSDQLIKSNRIYPWIILYNPDPWGSFPNLMSGQKKSAHQDSSASSQGLRSMASTSPLLYLPLVDFPIKNWWIFHSYLRENQRVFHRVSRFWMMICPLVELHPENLVDEWWSYSQIWLDKWNPPFLLVQSPWLCHPNLTYSKAAAWICISVISANGSRADSETRTADSETNEHADSETKIRKLTPRIRKLGFGN